MSHHISSYLGVLSDIECDVVFFLQLPWPRFSYGLISGQITPLQASEISMEGLHIAACLVLSLGRQLTLLHVLGFVLYHMTQKEKPCWV